MKKFNDYETTQSYSNSEKLPVGGYVLKVANVRYEEGQNGNSDRIQLMFDIAEGEQKDFFRKQYDSQTSEDKKWKRTVAIYVPKDDGTEQDGWKVNAVNNLAASLEESNSGYTWDWDETKLKGKFLGFLVREFEWSMNGNFGVSTEASSCTDVESIRNGKFKIPKMRKLKAEQNTASTQSQDSITDPDDLPF